MSSCPSCGADGLEPFYEVERVPVHSCRLVASREEALSFPTGRLELALCQACGFVPPTPPLTRRVQDYSLDLTRRHRHSRRTSSNSRGARARLDRALRPPRQARARDRQRQGRVPAAAARASASPTRSGSTRASCRAGSRSGPGCASCASSTRSGTRASSRTRSSAGTRSSTSSRWGRSCGRSAPRCAGTRCSCSSCQTCCAPCAKAPSGISITSTRPTSPRARWRGSSARPASRCSGSSFAYDDQYILIEARPGEGGARPLEEPPQVVADAVDAFRRVHGETASRWRERLAAAERPVIWGASSKGVAFLTTLGAGIELAVDVNPFKQERFLAGSPV